MMIAERYPELAELTKGSSFSQLIALVKTLGLVRYASLDQLRAVNFKLGTAPKIARLCELGFFCVQNPGVYAITSKSLELLKENRINTRILKQEVTGKGAKHTLDRTSVILEEMKDPDFYTVTYPSFKKDGDQWLVPDALLVFSDKANRRYKLEFLEVEEEKPDQLRYLEDKKEKYEELAKDNNIWEKWWKHNAELIGLPFCKRKDFCFSVKCYGNITANWRGWQWRENLFKSSEKSKL
jgi:hypothetical protein